MKRQRPRLLTALLILAVVPALSFATVYTTYYVRYGGAGAQTGADWDNAFDEIDDAFNAMPVGSSAGDTRDITIKVGQTTGAESYSKADRSGTFRDPTYVRVEGGYDPDTDTQVGTSRIKGSGVAGTDIGLYLHKSGGDHGEFMRLEKVDRFIIEDVQIGAKVSAVVGYDSVRPNIKLYNSTVTSGQHGLQVDWAKNYFQGPCRIVVTNSTITAGQDGGAADGDAIWCYGGQPQIAVRDSVLTSGVGGGIYARNECASDTTLREYFYVHLFNSQITNTADVGIYYADPNDSAYRRGYVGIRLIDSVVSGNSSNGVYVRTWNENDWSGGNLGGEVHLFATNSVIADNGGYGIYLYGRSDTRTDSSQVELRMANCTIADNALDAIHTRTDHNTFGTHNVQNTIIAGSGGDGIDVDDGDSSGVNVTENYNDFFSNTGSDVVEAGAPQGLGGNDITDDPEFLGAGLHPYRPGTGNAVLDAGNDAVAPAFDIMGVARPQDDHVSIGAYETGPPPPAETIVILH